MGFRLVAASAAARHRRCVRPAAAVSLSSKVGALCPLVPDAHQRQCCSTRRRSTPARCWNSSSNASLVLSSYRQQAGQFQRQCQQQRRNLHLSPREVDHLQLHNAGRLAQYRLARGLRLNHPEAVALISMQMLEAIRDGQQSVSKLMALGQTLLGRNQVMPGVPALVGQVQVEGTFKDGTKLLTVHSPIASENGNLEEALRGSFLPVPELSVFANNGDDDEDDDAPDLVAGKVMVASCDDDDEGRCGGITLNAGRELIELTVTNTGDRPVQVGSHYPLTETNRALRLDRIAAAGMRLNIPAGSSERFEPGDTKRVTAVKIGGNAKVRMGNMLSAPDGKVVGGDGDENDKESLLDRIRERGFLHEPEPEILPGRPYVMSRSAYADTYGPTAGDKIVLGDTSLVIEVEKDYTAAANAYGDECKFGGGKTIREGMGQSTSAPPSAVLDLVITNALIVDAVQGIVKADVGIKGTKIVGIGKAGNPDMMQGVNPGMIVGNATEVIAGEKLILTAGGIDTHVHWICPQQIEEAVSSGITTMFGGGTGPSAGTCATTCTPSPSQIEMMLKATDSYPLNFGFSGKGNTSDSRVLRDVLLSGAAGFKLHEDWGTTPAAISSCLDFADEHDVPVTIHTDTLNESGFVDDSIAAMKGRTIHTYHTEGAGGGHAPDIIKVVQEEHVLPSSTNPTRPFTVNTMDEHLDMLMVCHHLDSSIAEDVAFAESRIRGETIAAEDVLHDMGAISIMSSDSQAMGRVGEVICRTWQTADKMKRQRGTLESPSSSDDAGGDENNDNFRVKRYVAKYTVNPAIAHGMSNVVGSVETNKMADLVLWKPALFGCKPEMIIKGGTIAYAQMGDPNASIPTPQPVTMRPMFGAAASNSTNSVAFVSGAAHQAEIGKRIGLNKPTAPVSNCRAIGKKDMVHNDATPSMSVDPETFSVVADGELLECEPVNKVPLGQRFFLF